MTETDATNTEGNELEANEPVPRRKPRALQRIVVLGITAGCFVYLYNRLNGAAAREGLSLVDYMSQTFSNVQWIPWLLLMIAYSFLYFFIDTLVVTRALNWFIKEIRYRDILPIRASAYIISIFNEHGLLSQQARSGTGLGSWLGHVVHHVLRNVLFADLGHRRILRQW